MIETRDHLGDETAGPDARQELASSVGKVETPAAGGRRQRREAARPATDGGRHERTVIEGVDIEGPEPADLRERALYRAARRLRKAQAELSEARDAQRQAVAELRAEREKARDAQRLETAEMIAAAGVDEELLRQWALAKNSGDAPRAADLSKRLFG